MKKKKRIKNSDLVDFFLRFVRFFMRCGSPSRYAAGVFQPQRKRKKKKKDKRKKRKKNKERKKKAKWKRKKTKDFRFCGLFLEICFFLTCASPSLYVAGVFQPSEVPGESQLVPQRVELTQCSPYGVPIWSLSLLYPPLRKLFWVQFAGGICSFLTPNIF